MSIFVADLIIVFELDGEFLINIYVFIFLI